METHQSMDEENTTRNLPRLHRKQRSASTPELNRRHFGVKRSSSVLLLLLFIPAAAMPQKYGRPYSLPAIPELLLEVSVQKKTHYLSLYDLRKMPRSVVTATDPTTDQPHLYEGVALEKVVPIATLGSEGASIEIKYGSHQTLTISASDLEPRTESIVADTVDGKALSAYAPYDFVAKLRGKPALTIVGVRSIRVRGS